MAASLATRGDAPLSDPAPGLFRGTGSLHNVRNHFDPGKGNLMPLALRSALVVSAVGLACSTAPSGAAQDARRPPSANRVATGQSDGYRVFLEVFGTIARNHESALEDSILWQRAIDGLIGQLDDPYAVVFTPEGFDEFEEVNNRDYAGIGVQISQLEGLVTITAVFNATPAEKAGLALGDQIVEVEGVDATEWSLDQARDAIRGEPGSTVRIRVARHGFKDLIAVSIVRDNVHIAAVEATILDGGINHVRVDQFARNAAQELADALTDASEANAVIVDLRGNPGGYLTESLLVADIFLAPGQAVTSVGQRDGSGGVAEQTYTAEKQALIPNTPLVVLVDRFTASAAEIVAGALQDHDRAVVLGERTFGKGVVQTLYPLSDGRRMRLTTGTWYTPLGRSLHRKRNHLGYPLPEAEGDTVRVATAQGRRLRNSGGVFPDLAVARDTVAVAVRTLQEQAAEAQLQLGLKIEEYAVAMAKEAVADDEVSRVPSAAFDDLAQSIVDAGVAEEVVNDPEARAWLNWWTESRYLTRAGATGLALALQAERDRVLSEALRLARSAATQAELFQALEEVADQPSASER